MNTIPFPALVDEFSERVHEVLDAGHPRLAEALLALRDDLRCQDAVAPNEESPRAINERGSRFLAAALYLLGDRLFRQIFEFEPGQEINFPQYEEE